MKTTNLNQKQKIFFYLTTGAAIIGFLIIFLIWPTAESIKLMGDEIFSQKKALEEKFNKGQSLEILAKNIKNISADMDNFNQMFINKNSALEFVSALEKISVNNNVSQKIYLPTINIEPEQQFQIFELRLSVSGSYKNVMRYIKEIEHLDYFVVIKKINLFKNNNKSFLGNDENFTINLNLSADTYWN